MFTILFVLLPNKSFHDLLIVGDNHMNVDLFDVKKAVYKLNTPAKIIITPKAFINTLIKLRLKYYI